MKSDLKGREGSSLPFNQRGGLSPEWLRPVSEGAIGSIKNLLSYHPYLLYRCLRKNTL